MFAEKSPLTSCRRNGLTFAYSDSFIPYYGTECPMTTLYGALAMFPLGWALAGYALVSGPGSTERNPW